VSQVAPEEVDAILEMMQEIAGPRKIIPIR
jgi:hypothetical protein